MATQQESSAAGGATVELDDFAALLQSIAATAPKEEGK